MLLDGQSRASCGEQTLEPVAVEFVRFQPERVASTGRPEGLGTARKLLPQCRDAVLKDLRRGLRWILSPELVDDHVTCQRFVPVQQEQGQDGALPAAAERDSTVAVERFERPEDAVVHRGSACTYTVR